MHLEYRKIEQVHLNLAVRRPPRHPPRPLCPRPAQRRPRRRHEQPPLRRAKREPGSRLQCLQLQQPLHRLWRPLRSRRTDPSRTPETLAGIINELQKIKDGITEAELEKSKELVKGRLLLRTEDTRSVAGWYGAQEIVTGQVLMTDDVVQRVDAVTLEDTRRVAQTLLRTDNLNLAVVGPTRARKGLQSLLKI